MNQILDLRIDGAPFLFWLYLVTGATVATLLLLVVRRGTQRGTRHGTQRGTQRGTHRGTRHDTQRGTHRVARNCAQALAWVAVGALVGAGIAWLAGDVLDLFGVGLSPTTRMWSAAFFAGLALVILGLVTLPRRGRVVAALALPLVLLTAAAGINADFGQYPTLRTALGIPVFGALNAKPTVGTHGTVGSVTIPATVSGFHARPALIYLPPAALQSPPPVLPVVEMLSGQPGSPQDVFSAGQLASMLDGWAAKHGGSAPIVVVPDQLGAPERNPMCVDSALGNSATYLTVDVPRWVRAHFSVAPAAAGWAIAGFSQGGTCAAQLGAAHPELYGTLFDISGELVPRAGTPEQTIRAAFGGSHAAYAAAAPVAILAAHAPYASLRAILAVGGSDARYLAWTHTLADAATSAGVNTTIIISPGTSHDWHTVRYAWSTAMPLLARALGLDSSP
jgi:enterochelin esterase-like enzyme